MQIKQITSTEYFGRPGLRKKNTTSPNFASATILNNLVKAYNLSLENIDKSEKIKSFALGSNNTPGSLKLNYGIKNIDSSNPKFLENILVFGKGIIETSTNIEVPDSIDNSFYSFTFYDIYDGTEEISNCYLLGAIYFSYDNEIPEINFSIAKPKNDSDYLILHKDCDIKEVEKILKFDKSLEYPIEKNNYFLIYKFIVDIESFQNSRKLDRFFIYLYDLRTPESLFGLSEEALYSNMIRNIISGSNRIESVINVELINIINIVKAWINLDGWEPSFTEYWSISENPIPEDLKAFINKYLGISL